MIKIVLNIKNNAGCTTIPDFRLYYRDSQTALASNRHIDQWDRIKEPDLSQFYSYLSLTMMPTIYIGKRQYSQQTLLEKLDTYM